MSLSDNFSNNITALRCAQKSTLTSFAEEIAISRSHLENILKGNCNPTLGTEEQIAERLHIDPVLLLLSAEEACRFYTSPLCIQAMRELQFHLRSALKIFDDGHIQL